MSAHADKSQENKPQTSITKVDQSHRVGESDFQYIDNRPSTALQLKLEDSANNNDKATKLKSFQHLADKSSHANKLTQLQASTYTKQSLIQKKEKSIDSISNSNYSIDDINLHYRADKPIQLKAQDSSIYNDHASIKSSFKSDSPIQMVKPANKAAAQKLTVGFSPKKEKGKRKGGNHRGKEIRQQLIDGGEDKAKVAALTFMEYDVNAWNGKGNRDAERIVKASDGRIWYTDQHYASGSFQLI
jgi:hypothetical protein